MAEKSFIKGALVLTVAGVVAKMMGALYRIPFARIVGEEGSAIYGLVYPVYNLLLALSTAGIPLAISKLIAEREEQGYSQESLRIFKVALLLLSAVGLSVGVIIFINADWIAANVLHEPKAAWSLRALAPAMIFSCMQAVFRGYFQGLQQMVPTALSQITEQFIRVGVIMAVIFTLAGFGAETVAAGASFGASVGGFAALSLIVMLFLRHQRKQGIVNSKTPELAESNGKIIRQVLALAIPISIGSLVLPLMQSIDSVLVLPRLEAGGMSHLLAMGQFAYLSTYVAPIINLPFIITTAVAASLVPAISEALSAGKFDFVRKNFQSAMQLGILIVLPAAA
ncbi:MAG: polysaccharide biosynthesis protein, partial [Peptococcaceae bacterium]|nr:polysaccharide biosynthesis protein [Peptococcaceae bacterium]